MVQNRNLMQSIADRLVPDEEAIPGVPIVEIAGDRRILVERHEGITEYCHNQIGVKIAYGILIISGCNLKVTKMTKQQLIIFGDIDCVKICRRSR